MFVNSYYFRAGMYTLVPRHVREDMQWMRDHGTDAVTIAVLEQDLFAAVENMQLIQAEADRAGMSLFVVPSRWGALVAGSPKVPGLFCVRHPEACMRGKDGSLQSGLVGPIASVHHRATFDFFRDSIRNLHDFGCDGRPYRRDDGGLDDNPENRRPPHKLLCEDGPGFVDAARRHGKRPLFLLENHAMAEEDVAIMDRRLPEILAMGVEHFIYYYYPRSLKDPDRNMAVAGKHLLNVRESARKTGNAGK